MKNRILTLTALLILTTVMGSCKKGENDPFMSIKTRDARITGLWELVDLNLSSIVKNTFSGTTVTTVSSATYDGSLYTYISDGDATSFSYKRDLTINKDGSYTSYIVQDGNSQEMSGYWWWLDDTKKKTRIALDDDIDSFEIDRLTNKELVLTYYYFASDIDSDGELFEQLIEQTLTFEKAK
ncbi:MAG: hypothetical protein GQ574_08960 [Crocinitomix sp.]|nr:hypothetical protein [Crocinitomix sp.]